MNIIIFCVLIEELVGIYKTYRLKQTAMLNVASITSINTCNMYLPIY